jgi:hypothetical protein
MSTLKAIGGTLSQFGNKFVIGGLTGSKAIVDPTIEVNVPPEWEGTGFGEITNSNLAAFIAASTHFLEPAGHYIYHPGDENNTYSTNGIVYSWDKDFGSNFALSQKAFVSASDRNTNDSITLFLRSESISSGSILRQIDISDINVVFPDNGNPTNINTGSFYLETSSNFQIFNQHDYAFVIRAEDENGYQNRFNNSSIFNNFLYDVEYKAVVYPYGERPFIITQSNDVSISASTSPDDHINEMTFEVGNEGSPDFSVIPDIYIKQRQKIGGNTLEEIASIHNGSGADINDTLIPIYQATNLAYYATTIGDLPHTSNDTVFTKGLLPAQAKYQQTSSMRFFPLHFDSSSFFSKLSAKNSPYHLTITASTGQYTPSGVGSSTPPVETTASIYIVVDNENPTWTSVSDLIVPYDDIDTQLKKPAFISQYPSASDPGGDNITITNFTETIEPAGGAISTNHLETFHIEGSDTGSFYIITSSTFPGNLTTELKSNINYTTIVRALDECPVPGVTALPSAQRLFIDAPPSWSSEAYTIQASENAVGTILDNNASFATVADSTDYIGTTDSGDVTLSTGSGFVITCVDPRITADHFSFTGTDAVNGANATFSISTSSLFDRIDATAQARLIITASDNRAQERYHTFQVNVINVDDLPDVLGSSLFSDLRSFTTPKIEGVTTELQNSLANIESPTQSTSISSLSGSLVGSQLISTTSSLNISTLIQDVNQDTKAIITQNTVNRVLKYSTSFLNGTGAGSLVFWMKLSSTNNPTGLNTLFGNSNFGFVGNGSTSQGFPRIGSAVTPVILKYMPNNGIGISLDWHMITIAWTNPNNGDWYFWINDTNYINGTTVTQNLQQALKGATIGGNGAGTDSITELQPVSMSCAMTFNRTLSQNDVELLYTAFSGSHGL